MSDPRNTGLSQDAQAMMLFESTKKSALIAYLLWFLLGGLGAHRFYLGQTGSAVFMLILFVVSLFTWFIIVGLVTAAVLVIWLFIDIFLIPGIVQTQNILLMERIKGGHGI